jgi:hypothetical protein
MKMAAARAPNVVMPAQQAVRKLGEILQAMAQSEIFRDFFASERSEGSKKRTKRARVKTRRSFHTAWFARMTQWRYPPP